MSEEEQVQDETTERPAPPADPTFGAPDQPPAALTKANGKRDPILLGERGIQLRNLAELAEFSRMTYGSGLAPASFKNVQSVAVAIQKGMEHGLTPLAALSSVYVVNGMPTWTGKAALGLVRSSGLMVPGSYRAWIEGEGDKMVAFCESQRVGEGRVKTPFSVQDAKVAKLWNKKGRNDTDTPWITYPKRMLLWKAISHHMNDNYSDVLGGMPIAEDAIDVPAREVEPKKSLMASVAGPVAEDKLLAAAGVVPKPEPPTEAPAAPHEPIQTTQETARPLTEEEIQAKAVADHEDELEKAEREAIAAKPEPVPLDVLRGSLDQDPTFLRIQAKAGKKR